MKAAKRIFSQQAGFTLMELLVVVFIIAALSVPVLFMHQRVKDWMHKQEFYSVAKNFEKKAQAHYVKHLDIRKRAALGDVNFSNAELSPIPDPNQIGFSRYRQQFTNGTLYMIGRVEEFGGYLQVNGSSSNAAGYPPENGNGDRRSYFQYFDDVHDSSLTLDGWVRPTLLLVFVPNAVGLNQAYCPIRDSNTPKMLYISSGRDKTLATRTRARNALEIVDFYSLNDNTPFRTIPVSTGQMLTWNRGWRPSEWRGSGARNDNLYYKISFEALDQKYLDESIKKLRSIETTLKNSFYTKLSGHMELPTPDPSPKLDGNCNTTSEGLFLQPTRGNWFQIASDGNYFGGATPKSLANITGMSSAEMTDGWGNAILWDSSVNGTTSKACNVIEPELNFGTARLPTKQISYDFNGSASASTFIQPPYSARVFSACGYENASIPNYNALRLGTGKNGIGDTLWPSKPDRVVFDTNLTITVPGMF